MKKYYVYLLRCADDTLYTGFTTDLEKRLKMHNGALAGGAKYTRGRRPVTLAYAEEYESESEARKRECAIKRLTRTQKDALIANQK